MEKKAKRQQPDEDNSAEIEAASFKKFHMEVNALARVSNECHYCYCCRTANYMASLVHVQNTYLSVFGEAYHTSCFKWSNFTALALMQCTVCSSLLSLYSVGVVFSGACA